MDIDRYERTWIIISAVVLAGLFGVLLYSYYGQGIHLVTDAGQILPRDVRTTPPFDEPGLRQVGPDEYDLVMVAQAWVFTPRQVTIPAGSTVNFRMTSADVIHGFKIPGTTINLMVIPGQVTEASYRFREPGEYLFVCHEYCGAGHHVMSGVITVEQ